MTHPEDLHAGTAYHVVRRGCMRDGFSYAPMLGRFLELVNTPHKRLVLRFRINMVGDYVLPIAEVREFPVDEIDVQSLEVIL